MLHFSSRLKTGLRIVFNTLLRLPRAYALRYMYTDRSGHFTHAYTPTHTHIYICLCVYICIYMYIHSSVTRGYMCTPLCTGVPYCVRTEAEEGRSLPHAQHIGLSMLLHGHRLHRPYRIGASSRSMLRETPAHIRLPKLRPRRRTCKRRHRYFPQSTAHMPIPPFLRLKVPKAGLLHHSPVCRSLHLSHIS